MACAAGAGEVEPLLFRERADAKTVGYGTATPIGVDAALTAWHLVKDRGHIFEVQRNGAWKVVTVEQSEQQRDMALLRVPNLMESFLLADALPKDGQKLVIDGYPEGERGQARAKVEYLRGKLGLKVLEQPKQKYVWPKGAVTPGFSGAPVLDERGAMVGLLIQSDRTAYHDADGKEVLPDYRGTMVSADEIRRFLAGTALTPLTREWPLPKPLPNVPPNAPHAPKTVAEAAPMVPPAPAPATATATTPKSSFKIEFEVGGEKWRVVRTPRGRMVWQVEDADGLDDARWVRKAPDDENPEFAKRAREVLTEAVLR